MYKVGDILVDLNYNEKKVLVVCGEIYALSYIDDFFSFGDWYTQTDLDGIGYKLKPDPKEMTLEEVSKELGYEIKIVEGKE